VRAKYNQNYKKRTRMRRARNSKENDTKKRLALIQNQRAVLPRILATKARLDNSGASEDPESSMDADFFAMRWRVRWRSTQTHRTHLAYQIWRRGPKIGHIPGPTTTLK
jgi:predicted phage gp36 major capsid-like protein